MVEKYSHAFYVLFNLHGAEKPMEELMYWNEKGKCYIERQNREREREEATNARKTDEINQSEKERKNNS